ncbi:MAG: DUF2798 domain-containing protein [Oscillospiraceae bacterium]|nr:DUF2798 domain-containing protein [Oscillospiraceae bacterium]
MPENKFERFMFALFSVIVTVNAFVFYNVFFVEKMTYAKYGAKTIISFLLIEFTLAMICELFAGGPGSFKLAFKAVDPKENKPYMVETAVICATVCIMCPLMSFLAVFIYNGFTAYIFSPENFDMTEFWINFIPNWFTKIFYNFPFALLSQLFFIQPLVRVIFKALFRSDKVKYGQLEN